MATKVRLGVQNTPLLSDIYTMFKTGTDEDKAQFQNVFANLGERLGKYDQDIEFRRTMGDQEAMKQRTMGEGVGDTLGGLWDYTKKGAGAVADLFTGSDAIEPEQKISSEVQGMTLKADPFAQEETMSKEENGFPIGGMSKENPVIQPQEKVFNEVNTQAPAESAIKNETPFAKRMRERVANLTEQNNRFTDNPDLMWAELQRIDPERAAFIKGKEAKQVGPTGNKLLEIQQRMEDQAIDAEVNKMASDLLTDAVANGWDETNPEYMKRWAEIEAKSASKWKSTDKTVMDKYQKAIVDKRKEEFDIKKQQADAEYKLEQQDMDALKMVVDISSDTFAKAKDVPVQLNKVQGLLAEGVNNQNYKAIDAAAKILIQSFDNSAVLGNEIGMLADSSLVGQINSFINKIANGTTYTQDDVKKLWEMSEAIRKQNDLVFDEAAKRSQTTYKALRGKESPAINVLFKAYKSMSPTSTPDFNKLPATFTSQWGKANIELKSDKPAKGSAQAAATGLDFSED